MLQLGEMDGERLCSINCLPLSTIEIKTMRINENKKEEHREERGAVRLWIPDAIVSKKQSRRLLPSSSSSEVIDLERMDRAVVGALFGGGGAGGHRFIQI